LQAGFTEFRSGAPAPGSATHPSSATPCESKVLLVSRCLNSLAEYRCPAGVLIETAKPSAASLRASIAALTALGTDVGGVVIVLYRFDDECHVVPNITVRAPVAYRKPRRKLKRNPDPASARGTQ
jgi:hypothetical protein